MGLYFLAETIYSITDLLKIWCKDTKKATENIDYLRIFVILQTNMNVLGNIKTIALKLWRSQVLKYAVVCLIGVLIVGFLDENSVMSHLKNRQRISELEEEIDKYNADFRRDQSQIRELDRNPKAMEKVARERYYMKADDEDIFILSDDDRAPKPIVTNETAE